MESNSATPPKEEEENCKVNFESIDQDALSLLSFPTNGTKLSKKDDRNLAALMKALTFYPTVEERLDLICQKHVMAAEENRKLHFYIKQAEKRYNYLNKEKEQLQTEYNKMVVVKVKLENLCRELQKQNKVIRDDSTQKIRELKRSRKETHNKFQATLSEISAMVQKDCEKNAELHDENVNMSDKFKSILEEYKLREQQVEKMSQQIALEQQLADAKLQKAKLEHQAERERLLAEMEQVKLEVAQYRAKVVELKCTETSLRGQLAIHTDKYDEFQDALVRSNKAVGLFKKEMERMSNKMQSLEKMNTLWKSRWEKSQVTLVASYANKQVSEDKLASTQKQLEQMQKLCRTLQAERTLLHKTLKEHNIERPSVPVITEQIEKDSKVETTPDNVNKCEDKA